MPFQFARRMKAARPLRAALLLFLLLFTTHLCPAYSVLTHEEIIDLLWKDQIVPLLKRRYPNATEEDLRKAHAFAVPPPAIPGVGASARRARTASTSSASPR